MRHEITLAGCNPTPLASYLKALGVLRLVAEQADSSAQGYWRHNGFVLRSRLDGEALSRFLLDDYRPTPILAPWNGGSGFYPKDNQEGFAPMASARAERFRALRDAIETMRVALADRGLSERPSGEDKAALLARLRAELDEPALRWLDAAVVLAESDPKYPPLLGTGGNDGRLDFTNNFLRRLVGLFDPDSGQANDLAVGWLESALFGTALPGLGSVAIGQFDPGSAGGPNAGTGFEASSRVNIWDFVLMLEGALLFAAAATRKLEHGQRGLSYPFTVRPTGSGSGAAAFNDEGQARAEIWMPLWDNPASLVELEALLREGRARLKTRSAQDGLDFARAISALGVDRGITAFQRYVFMMRSGKAYLATPLNYVHVRDDSNPATLLVNQLDDRHWLSNLRRLGRDDKAPGRVAAAVRQLEDALFDLTQASQRQPERFVVPTQRALLAIGRLLPILGQSPRARERCPVLPRLGAEWLTMADDGSDEFRVAAALAGLQAPGLPMRAHIVALNATSRDGRHLVADDKRCTWSHGPLLDNLSRLLHRRLLYAQQTQLDDKPLYGRPPADLNAVAAFLAGQTRDDRITPLMAGLSLLDATSAGLPPRNSGPAPLPSTYTLMKPLFSTDHLLRRLGFVAETGRLPLPPALPRLLTAGPIGITRAVQLAIQRRQAVGLPYAFKPPRAPGLDGKRLLAALMIPISAADTARLVMRTLADTASGESDHEVRS